MNGSRLAHLEGDRKPYDLVGNPKNCVRSRGARGLGIEPADRTCLLQLARSTFCDVFGAYSAHCSLFCTAADKNWPMEKPATATRDGQHSALTENTEKTRRETRMCFPIRLLGLEPFQLEFEALQLKMETSEILNFSGDVGQIRGDTQYFWHFDDT